MPVKIPSKEVEHIKQETMREMYKIHKTNAIKYFKSSDGDTAAMYRF